MDNQFGIADLLPLFPWEGPPLPRFLCMFWPWLGAERTLQLPQLPMPSIESSYENEEVWSWIDWKGREREITVTRKAKVS